MNTNQNTTWKNTPLRTITLATTGIKPEENEICGYTIMDTTADGTILSNTEALVRTQNPIPTAASNIHGLTQQLVNSDQPAPVARLTLPEAINNLTAALTGTEGNRPILTLFNAPWIVQTIYHNATRAGVRFAPETISPYLIDPLVLDRKNISRSATGGRTLAALAAKQGTFPPDGRVSANAYATGHLTHTLISRIPIFRNQTPEELSQNVRTWYYEAEEEHQTYQQSRGRYPRPIEPWANDPIQAQQSQLDFAG